MSWARPPVAIERIRLVEFVPVSVASVDSESDTVSCNGSGNSYRGGNCHGSDGLANNGSVVDGRGVGVGASVSVVDSDGSNDRGDDGRGDVSHVSDMAVTVSETVAETEVAGGHARDEGDESDEYLRFRIVIHRRGKSREEKLMRRRWKELILKNESNGASRTQSKTPT